MIPRVVKGRKSAWTVVWTTITSLFFTILFGLLSLGESLTDPPTPKSLDSEPPTLREIAEEHGLEDDLEHLYPSEPVVPLENLVVEPVSHREFIVWSIVSTFLSTLVFPLGLHAGRKWVNSKFDSDNNSIQP